MDGFLDQPVQQLCECLGSWEGRRGSVELFSAGGEAGAPPTPVMDNNIWAVGISQRGKGRQGDTDLSCVSLLTLKFPWHLQP